MPSQSKIKVGTDCSGMEALVHALLMLKVPLEHMFSCDVLPAAVATIRANHKPKYLFPDLMKRNNASEDVPYVDGYVAGFPCQSFSLAGKRLGFEDPRGKILWGLLDYIDHKRPKVCLLENVSNLIHLDGGKVLETVLQCLREVGGGCYNVTWSKLDTCQHGVPQSRPTLTEEPSNGQSNCHLLTLSASLRSAAAKSLRKCCHRRAELSSLLDVPDFR